MLGAVELVDADGHACPIGSTSQRTLLAVLLAAHGEVVGLDALVDAVWADAPPPTAVPTLRTYVSRLRAQLGPALAARGGGYALDVPPGALDADRFETLVDAARGAGAAEAADLLAAALDLWHGPAYGDCADIERVRAEARRLEERRQGASEAHAAALLRAGRIDDAVAAAEALVAAEPLREGGWAVLIEALASAHRTADALRAYRRAAAALAEAGLEPTRVLRDAERIALDDAAPRTATQFPPTADRSRRFRPPLVPSSIVGRDDDTTLIAELVGTTRLLTLTGPGGVGKTRLAVEVAHRATPRRQLGACLVELASVANPASVPDTIVATLGLTADGRPAVDILPSIGDLDMLIVLDNAEHVIEAAAAAVQRILSGGPSASVLATSREPLAVEGEHVWTVAPLATAGADASAATLFRQRAAAVGAIADDTVVMRIVQRLDGLPLAIEMAAAQLDTTSPVELADALDERLDTLRSMRRHAPARHRSLNEVLAWSEARLDDTEAATLADHLRLRRTSGSPRHRRRPRAARRRRCRAHPHPPLPRQHRSQRHTGALPSARNDPLLRPPTPCRRRPDRRTVPPSRRMVRRRHPRRRRPTPHGQRGGRPGSRRIRPRRTTGRPRLGVRPRPRSRRRPVSPPLRVRAGPLLRRATAVGRATPRSGRRRPSSPPRTPRLRRNTPHPPWQHHRRSAARQRGRSSWPATPPPHSRLSTR